MFNIGALTAFALFLAVTLFVLIAVSKYATGGLPRRVERFARRQQLWITPDNEAYIVYYLVTTRRWRRGLLIVGIVASLFIRHGANDGDIDLSWCFAGWIAGAVIGEWRVLGGVPGPRAMALLRPRRLADYVPQLVLAAIGAVWVLAAATIIAGLAVSVRHHPYQRTHELLLLGAAVLIAVLVPLATRSILLRPQPLAAEDLIRADNAVRSRSLNVLGGSMLAMGGLLVSSALVDDLVGQDTSPAFVLNAIFGLALPIVGVMVATKPRRTPVFGVPLPVDA